MVCSVFICQALIYMSPFIHISAPGCASGKESTLLMQETLVTWVRPLGWEDPLEEEIHSSVLARRIPWTEETGGLHAWGHKRIGHD